MGLENRFIENKDIFIEIVVKYTTGLKNFKGIAVLDNNNLAFNFNGLTQKLDVKDLIKLICKEAENYDSVEILYKERGTYILIQGSNKKVNMKNIDVKEEAENKNY